MIRHRRRSRSARCPPTEILQRGIAMVPEGRKLFPSLTVEENLLIGGQVRKAPGRWYADCDLRPLPDPEGAAPLPGHGAFGRASSRWSRSAAR